MVSKTSKYEPTNYGYITLLLLGGKPKIEKWQDIISNFTLAISLPKKFFSSCSRALFKGRQCRKDQRTIGFKTYCVDGFWLALGKKAYNQCRSSKNNFETVGGNLSKRRVVRKFAGEKHQVNALIKMEGVHMWKASGGLFTRGADSECKHFCSGNAGETSSECIVSAISLCFECNFLAIKCNFLHFLRFPRILNAALRI